MPAKPLLIAGIAAAALWAAPGALAAGPAPCTKTLDDFNRPDSTDLGPDWTEQAQDFEIVGGLVTNPLDEGLITFNRRAAHEACVDVSAAGAVSTTYVALVLGYANLENNVFVKVQDNNSDQSFDHTWFYYGNNGDGWAPSEPLTPFAAARIHLVRSGSQVTLNIDHDFDGAPEQSITRAGLPTENLGIGIGLGVYNGGKADNFAMTDTIAPLTIKRRKRVRPKRRRAVFGFGSNEPQATFRCRLDARPFKRCSSPSVLRRLKPGRHRFRVRAVDDSGNPGNVVGWRFRIPRPR